MVKAVLAALFVLAGCTHNFYQPTYRCHRYVIAPPLHQDPLVSDYLRERWMHLAVYDLRPCDSFVGPEESSTVLAMLDVTHRKAADPKSWDQRRRNVPGQRVNATHIVILDYSLSADGEVRFVPKILRMFDLKQEVTSIARAIRIPLPEAGRKLALASEKKPWLVTQIDLIPNTILMGYASPEMVNDLATSAQVFPCEYHETSFLPPVLSSIGITNAAHQDRFRIFDFEARFFPSIDFGYFDSQHILSRTDCAVEDSREEYRLELLTMSGLLNGETALVSPLGITFLQLGLGVGLGARKENEGSRKAVYYTAFRFGIGHRVFFRARLFGQVDVEQLSFRPKVLTNELFQSGTRSRIFFGIGYYFPTGRNYVRKKYQDLMEGDPRQGASDLW